MSRVDSKNSVYCILVCLAISKLQIVGSISVDKFLSLTLSEKIALDKFREKVAPLLIDECMKLDTYLIRWLRAQNLDINSAELMLRKNLKWRQEYKVENLKKEDFSDITIDYPLTTDTHDKTGRPVLVLDIYEWDIRRVVLQGKGPRSIRYEVNHMEKIANQICKMQLKGMNVTQFVILMNADGFNLVQQACPMCLPFWVQPLTIIQNYYPEWLDEFIVIDAPPNIQVVMNALRPFLSQKESG